MRPPAPPPACSNCRGGSGAAGDGCGSASFKGGTNLQRSGHPPPSHRAACGINSQGHEDVSPSLKWRAGCHPLEALEAGSGTAAIKHLKQGDIVAALATTGFHPHATYWFYQSPRWRSDGFSSAQLRFELSLLFMGSLETPHWLCLTIPPFLRQVSILQAPPVHRRSPAQSVLLGNMRVLQPANRGQRAARDSSASSHRRTVWQH